MVKFYLTFLLSCCLTEISAQDPAEHSSFFEVSNEDIARWNSYEVILSGHELGSDLHKKSLLEFAKNEYEVGQYSKVKELCLTAFELGGDLAVFRILLGKAYVSGYKGCENRASVKGEQVWAALDEWEKIPSTSSHFPQVKILMTRYRKFLPSASDLRNCWEAGILVEGASYFVSCWIRKDCKVRTRKEH